MELQIEEEVLEVHIMVQMVQEDLAVLTMEVQE
jgi:hypothetical protein